MGNETVGASKAAHPSLASDARKPEGPIRNFAQRRGSAEIDPGEIILSEEISQTGSAFLAASRGG
jgi:hypothetical protein